MTTSKVNEHVPGKFINYYISVIAHYLKGWIMADPVSQQLAKQCLIEAGKPYTRGRIR